MKFKLILLCKCLYHVGSKFLRSICISSSWKFINKMHVASLTEPDFPYTELINYLISILNYLYVLHHQFWAQFIKFSSIFCLQVRLCNSIAQGQHPQFFIEGLEFNFPRSANWLDMVSIFLLTPCHVLLGMLSKQKQEGKRLSTKVIKRIEYLNNLRYLIEKSGDISFLVLK